MELLWAKLISDYPGNDEGHGGFFYGSCLVFELGGKFVSVHGQVWNSRESQKLEDHVVFDSFDIVSGERDRSIYTSPDMRSYLSFIMSHSSIIDNNLILLFPLGDIKFSSLDRNRREKEMPYRSLRYSDKGIIAKDIVRTQINKENPQEEVYTFGDYELSSRGYNMICKEVSTKEIVWKKRHAVSGLYTPIEEKDGVIYFGTSGNGGHFYALSLKTGETICDIDNGGCEHYAWYKDKVCIASRKGDVLMFDPLSGKDPQELKLYNVKLGDYSPILVYNDYLFTLADIKKKEKRSVGPFLCPLCSLGSMNACKLINMYVVIPLVFI